MRRITPNFCYHLATARIKRIQAKASFYCRQSVLSSPIAYPTLSHHRKRTSHALRMLLAQILTYMTPTVSCTVPMGADFVAWKPKPGQQQLRLLSAEADRSRPKPTKSAEADKSRFLMHLMHLTPNRQRDFSNKINSKTLQNCLIS